MLKILERRARHIAASSGAAAVVVLGSRCLRLLLPLSSLLPYSLMPR